VTARKIICTKSVLYPGTEEIMGGDTFERGLRVVL
jgi:predicted naringenin-chalcone synthase